MKTKPIAFLACRILSIYIFTRVLTTGYSTLYFSTMSYRQNLDTEILGMLFGFIGPLVLLIISSILLWIFADGISSLMVRGLKEETTGLELTSQELQTAGFSITGLVILAAAIPEIFQVISRVITLSNASQYGNPMMKIEIAYMIFEKIVRFAIALTLLFGARRIVHFIHSARNAGLDKMDT